jgi:hypothetical protein
MIIGESLTQMFPLILLKLHSLKLLKDFEKGKNVLIYFQPEAIGTIKAN